MEVYWKYSKAGKPCFTKVLLLKSGLCSTGTFLHPSEANSGNEEAGRREKRPSCVIALEENSSQEKHNSFISNAGNVEEKVV